MNDIDRILLALKRSYLFQVNCELTEVHSKMLLDLIEGLRFAVNEQPELQSRIAELEAENKLLADSCEILRKQTNVLFRQVFSDGKPEDK